MDLVQRRAFIRFLIGGAALAASAGPLSSTTALAAPFPIDVVTSALDAPVEKAAVRTTCWWRRGRRVCHRRRVRRVCWWRAGRRVCAWR